MPPSMSPFRSAAPDRTRRAPLLLAVLLLGGAAGAEESEPIRIRAVASSKAPFKLSVPAARLISGPGGENSLAFELSITNTTSDRLVTTSGWSLDVLSPDGRRLRRASFAQSLDIEPNKARTTRHRLDSKALGKVDASYAFEIRPATAATVSAGLRCQGPSGSCEGAEYQCELWCNNPLVPQGGVASYSCSCNWYWDGSGQCWRYVCGVACECAGLPEPPYDDPFVVW